MNHPEVKNGVSRAMMMTGTGMGGEVVGQIGLVDGDGGGREGGGEMFVEE